MKTELTTSFMLLHKAGACQERYHVLAKALGGVRQYGRDRSISLLTVLEICGFDDTLWCLRAVLPEEQAWRDQLARLLAADYAEHVAYLYRSPEPDTGWWPAWTAAEAARAADAAAATWDTARTTWTADRDAERRWQAARLKERLSRKGETQR